MILHVQHAGINFVYMYIFFSAVLLYAVQSRMNPPGSGTTQELLQLAPESAAATRRRLRAERKAAAESAKREEEERWLSSKYQHRRPQERGSASSR